MQADDLRVPEPTVKRRAIIQVRRSASEVHRHFTHINLNPPETTVTPIPYNIGRSSIFEGL